MYNRKTALLKLDKKRHYQGFHLGYDRSIIGEVVFSTSMVGYPEALTDPSFYGQILTLTYPLIGNYGVPNQIIKNGLSTHFESEKIMVKGLIISDYSTRYSHWRAIRSLDEWLKEEKIPALYGVDTREIVKKIREGGAVEGELIVEGSVIESDRLNDIARVAAVSCKEPITYGGGDKRVVVVDCGVRHTILQRVIDYNVELLRVPWDFDFNKLQFDGLIISNGPGDPKECHVTAKHISTFIESERDRAFKRPLFGICLGNLLLAKAIGAETSKLKYGHSSTNQPVKAVGSERCYITAQNHSYVVKSNSLPEDWNPSFINLNDCSIEGIAHSSLPYFGTQFFPGEPGGSVETQYIFDNFITLLQ